MVESPKFVSLYQSKTREYEELRDHVSGSKGYLGILVHPFYHDFYHPLEQDGTVIQPESPQKEKYEKLREEYLTKKFDQGKPVVIFESFNNYDRLKNRLKGREGTVFTVETNRSSPYPFNSDWHRIGELLNNLGVTKINLSGEYFSLVRAENVAEQVSVNPCEYHVDPTEAPQTIISLKSGLRERSPSSNILGWASEGLVPMGCVGQAAIDLLSLGFNVRVTPMTCPLPRVVLSSKTNNEIGII